jgi:flagellar assembly factor FliW
VITFPEGLVGFQDYTQFVLICPKEGSQFRWLQSVEDPNVAFLSTVPFQYVPDYSPVIPSKAAKSLGLGKEAQPLVFVTVSIPRGRPEDMTLNLAGPIIINPETRKGKQVILENDSYSVRHRAFSETVVAPVAVAA